MMRKLFIVCLTLITFTAVSVNVCAMTSISAKSAVLYCMETGEFVFEKDADAVLPMASTTKLMTSLIAMEYCSEMEDLTVEITAEEAATEGSSMGLCEGDKIKLSSLCAGMMLPSGNDAANAAARAISDDFSSIMNSKAKNLGMKSTNFVTPSGLDAPNHHTTARDMAILAAAVLENEKLAEIASSPSLKVTYNDGNTTTVLENHNRLLKTVDGCIGLKTGYTQSAGRCLVSAVRRDGVTLICVTLNDPDDWKDHEMLYNSYFDTVKSYNTESLQFILNSTDGKLKAEIEDTSPIKYFIGSDIEEKVYLPRFVYSGMTGTVGRVEYIKDGEIIDSRNIIVTAE